jgi:hypothetical protein
MYSPEINCRGSNLLETIEIHVCVAIAQVEENLPTDHQNRQASGPCFFVVGLSEQVGVLYEEMWSEPLAAPNHCSVRSRKLTC